MGIGKPKQTQIDIEELMDEIGADRQVRQEEAASDKRLEELRTARIALKEAAGVLHEATASLNAAQANAESIIASLNKAIVDAQENTKFKVRFEREDMEQMMNLSITALKTDEIMMKQHHDRQLKSMEVHERKIAKILSRNEGVWLSDFWMKVLVISILLFSLLALLYVQIKT